VIAVDTSALMAIVLSEAEGFDFDRVLKAEAEIAISAGTLAEALIVAARRGVSGQMQLLLDGLGLEVVPVTAETAVRVADAYARWGKGVHPASLNLGDCFAYELAQSRGCPLLFIGADFARTDTRSAI
jgi:ribonuclease VapC